MTYTELLFTWTGFPGAPGYSKFRFSGALTAAEARTAADNVRTMFASIVPHLPLAVHINAPTTGSHHEVNGDLIDEVNISPALAVVDGGGSSGYSAASGAVINWNTGAVHQGHKVRGRTFLVPLAGGAYEADGTLSATPLGQIRAAASTLAGSSPKLVILSHKGPLGGTSHLEAEVQNATVPDKAAVLRSRRD